MSELNKIVTNFPMSLSQDENRNLALTLSAVLEGGGGGVANAIWKPAVDQDGLMTWSWDTFPDSARPPETVNIKGPRGESGAPGRDGTNGTNGTNGKDGLDGKTPQIQINSSNAHWEWRYSEASEWTDLGVVASGEVGPQGIPGVSGAPGAPGAKGEDGYSPSVTTSEIPVSTEHPQGGTSVTITDKTGQHQFDVWNGINGEGATVNLLDGSGIHIEQNGTNYTIGVSADYALRSELPDVTDMATETWVAEQGYLTVVPDSYATKSYVNEASANALSQAESWVETQGYLKSVSVASGSLAGSGTTNEPLALKTSAEQALSSVANKLEPPPHNTQQSTNYIWSDPLGQGIPGWIDANNWLDEALENTEFLHAEDLRWYISPENGVSGKWDNEEEELKLGIDTSNMTANKQYAFTTTGWEEVVVPSTSGYLPTSGGTVSGQLEVHGGSNFDQQFLKLTREGVTGHARLGLGQYGALALKTDDSNSHTTQVNISPNAANDQLVQVQHNGNQVGYLIPAQIHQGSYTPTSADGILHIVLES